MSGQSSAFSCLRLHGCYVNQVFHFPFFIVRLGHASHMPHGLAMWRSCRSESICQIDLSRLYSDHWAVTWEKAFELNRFVHIAPNQHKFAIFHNHRRCVKIENPMGFAREKRGVYLPQADWQLLIKVINCACFSGHASERRSYLKGYLETCLDEPIKS